MNTSFFSEMLQSIADRSRALIKRERREPAHERSAGIVELCEELLSGRGEASGVALAQEILARYADLTTGPRIAFFEALATTFGHDRARIDRAIAAWRDVAERRQRRRTASCQRAAAARIVPPPQSRARRHRGAGAHARAIARRHGAPRRSRRSIDNDFVHLFSSWFNRGFLVLRRIDWSTSAAILEKIIRYEAVHEISDWDDLRRRIDPPDRRCYAFFHPALVDEPLIFVEVALTREIPGAIAPILSDKREPVEPQRATTAVFYSITNCQRGLAGVTFGHFLIKQVVEEVSRECPRVATFVTLSPAPNFAALAQARARQRGHRRRSTKTIARRSARSTPRIGGERRRSPNRCASRCCAPPPGIICARATAAACRSTRWRAFISATARGSSGSIGSPTRRSGRCKQSYGLMVNYLYDLDYIERNHEAYAQQRAIVAASAVTRLVTAPAREIVPVSG